MTHMGEYFKNKRLERKWTIEEVEKMIGDNTDWLYSTEEREEVALLTSLRLGELYEIPKIELLLLQGTLSKDDILSYAEENKMMFSEESIRKEKLKKQIDTLTEKEREVLGELISPVYFSESHKYERAIWGSIHLLMSDELDILERDIELLYDILNPEDED